MRALRLFSASSDAARANARLAPVVCAPFGRCGLHVLVETNKPMVGVRMASKLSSATVYPPPASSPKEPVYQVLASRRAVASTACEAVPRTDVSHERRSVWSAPATRSSPLRPPHVAATPSGVGKAPVLSRVRPHLWIADKHGASTLTALRQTGVTHALLCSGDMTMPFAEQLAYRRLGRLYDEANSSLRDDLPGALSWMSIVLQQGGEILISCSTGNSCSAAIVCAYLMWVEQLSYEQALQQVQQARPQAAPNVAFVETLVAGNWQRDLPRALLPAQDMENAQGAV